MMGTVPFQPLFLNQHLERFRSAAPLVFMNACRTGGEAPLYTRLAGWAHSFLAAGVGAFVGSLWEVRDGTARQFAEQFYRALLEGQDLGAALSIARESVRDEAGDPTWLAYAFYGDPAATVAWEATP
jgi:CHAT domain-containing protein